MSAVDRVDRDVKKAATGDHDAICRLVERNRRWLINTVREHLPYRVRWLGLDGTTDDFLQGLSVSLFQSAPFGIRNEEEFRGVLYRRVRNLIVDEARAMSAQRRDVGRQEALDTAKDQGIVARDASAASVAQLAAQNELDLLVKHAVELLPDQERTVLKLRFFRGMAYRSIGKELSISGESARLQCKEALGVLKRTVRALRENDVRRALGDTAGDDMEW